MVDPWLLEHLVCPIDHQRLTAAGDQLSCAAGHAYPIVDDVPVMLIAGIDQTMDLAHASLARARGALVDARAPELHLESIGISDDPDHSS